MVDRYSETNSLCFAQKFNNFLSNNNVNTSTNTPKMSKKTKIIAVIFTDHHDLFWNCTAEALNDFISTEKPFELK